MPIVSLHLAALSSDLTDAVVIGTAQVLEPRVELVSLPCDVICHAPHVLNLILVLSGLPIGDTQL